MEKKSRILKWSLIIGIVIVLNLFFNYALSVAYQSPEYENFCKAEQVQKVYETQQSCVNAGGQWTSTPKDYYPIPAGVKQPAGYCDSEFTCRNDFQNTLNNYNKNVFVTLVILGVISIAISLFITAGGEVISLALSLGGVLSFVIASIRYWSSANDVIKVIILGIALAGLITLAVKKFNEKIQS